jgi:hypothetical protein
MRDDVVDDLRQRDASLLEALGHHGALILGTHPTEIILGAEPRGGDVPTVGIPSLMPGPAVRLARPRMGATVARRDEGPAVRL